MRNALKVLPGVGQIDVDFDKRQVTVQVADGTDESTLVAALKKAEYGATIVASGPITQAEKPNRKVPENEIPTEVTYSMQSFAEHVKVSAVVDAAPLRPGDEFRIGVVFDIEKGWHIYGNPVGPGIGRATSLSVRSSENATMSAARYTPGHKAEQSFGDSGKTWVWESTDRVVHYVSGRISPDAKPGRTTWLLQAKAQACTATQCLPAKIKIPVTVDIAPSGSPRTKEHQDDFAGFEQARAAKDA